MQRIGPDLLQRRPNRAFDERSCLLHASVEKDGPDDGFEGSAEQRRAVAAAALLLAKAQSQVAAEVDSAGEVGQRLRAHQRRPQGGQFALVHLGKAMIEVTGHDEVDHRVAQKLQPLVVLGGEAGVLVEVGAMSQSACQQRVVADFDTQSLAQFKQIIHEKETFRGPERAPVRRPPRFTQNPESPALNYGRQSRKHCSDKPARDPGGHDWARNPDHRPGREWCN